MTLECLIRILAKLEITSSAEWTQLSPNRFKCPIVYQCLAINQYRSIATLLVELELEDEIELSLNAQFDTDSYEFFYSIILYREAV